MDFMWKFWDPFFHIAMQVPHDREEQELLVELIKCLQNQRPQIFMREAMWDRLPCARMASVNVLD